MDNLDRIRYYENRINRMDSNRNKLALREIQTLDIICRISSINTSPQSALDLGCGDKFLEHPLRQRSVAYTGLDIKDCDFDNEDLPFEDNSFDMIISLAVIEHLANPIRVITNCHRVLSPGGYILCYHS